MRITYVAESCTKVLLWDESECLTNNKPFITEQVKL